MLPVVVVVMHVHKLIWFLFLTCFPRPGTGTGSNAMFSPMHDTRARARRGDHVTQHDHQSERECSRLRLLQPLPRGGGLARRAVADAFRFSLPHLFRSARSCCNRRALQNYAPRPPRNTRLRTPTLSLPLPPHPPNRGRRIIAHCTRTRRTHVRGINSPSLPKRTVSNRPTNPNQQRPLHASPHLILACFRVPCICPRLRLLCYRLLIPAVAGIFHLGYSRLSYFSAFSPSFPFLSLVRPAIVPPSRNLGINRARKVFPIAFVSALPLLLLPFVFSVLLYFSLACPVSQQFTVVITMWRGAEDRCVGDPAYLYYGYR